MPVNVKVSKRRGESDERLIRRFNRRCKKLRIVEEYKARCTHHIKPSIKKRLKRQKAIREQLKRAKKEQDKLFR
tara:strand:+ start:265 stop:486 length:222 start_codon:yes stop_codon:yes gene_type:complete